MVRYGQLIYHFGILFWGRGATVLRAAPTDTLRISLDQDLAGQLLPFERIFDLAVRTAPTLRAEDVTVEARLLAVQQSRTAILNYLSPTAAYHRGTATLLNVGTNASESFSLNNGYRLGATVSLPLGEVFNRRSKIQTARLEQRQAVIHRDQARQTFKRELSRAYQSLLLAQRVLRLTIRDARAGEIAYRVAEVNYQKNRISPDQYAAASAAYTSAQITVEQKRTDFMALLYDFEILAGVELNRLLLN